MLRALNVASPRPSEQARNDRQIADILFAAATDHRFIDIGHPLDFTNKALEALDVAGWGYAEPVLTGLVAAYASAERDGRIECVAAPD